MAKKQLSSQANLMRQEGVPALGDSHVKRNNNPIAYYCPDKQKYKDIWTQYDLNQFCSLLVWEGLPNGLTSWNLNRMLYFRGTLCGFIMGGKVYILPYVIKGKINPYGLPVNVRPISFNGKPVAGANDFLKKDFILPINEKGDETDKYTAVLLYSSVPYSTASQSPSRFSINQIIIDEIADTLARVNINIVVSNKKILLQVKDPKQADVVREELTTAFGSDSPFGVITTPLEASSIQSVDDFNADDLFNTVKNWDAVRCFMTGIASKNFGTEKKERLVSGELAGNEEQINLVADLMLDFAKLFCDQMNKRFGTSMSVRLRKEDYEEEVNGNNNTKLDEEGEL